MTSFSALVVAGGTGRRMGSAVPKQFLELDGKPVLMYTLEQFSKCPENPEIILVLPPGHENTWKSLCEKYTFDIKHQVVEGGATRAGSVVNGLKKIAPDSIVAIHDGVRPFVSCELISRCFQLANDKGSAIPAIPLRDSLREIKGDDTLSCDRENFRLIQTPQCFRTSEILDCYMSAPLNFYTDDAGIAEDCGIKITLTEGEEHNIKITTPFDMMVAEAFLKSELNSH